MSFTYSFPGVELIICHHWFRLWHGTKRGHDISWTNNDQVPWRIYTPPSLVKLTHWGRVTHICVSKLAIIGPDNGLSPHRRQAIIWTNVAILLIGPLGTNFSEIIIGIQTLSFKKICLKMSSAKWHPFCLGLNVLTHWGQKKMAAIWQMLFSNSFCNEMFVLFQLKFHWNLFPWVQSTTSRHWFR